MLKKIQRKVLGSKEAYLILVSLLIVNLIVIACQKQMTHQDRVNTISNAMNIVDETWEATDTVLLEMARAGKLSNANIDKRSNAATIVIKLNKNWKLTPQTDASIEAFILSPDFINGAKLIAELAKVAQVNDIDLNKLLDSINQLKKEK